MVDMITWCCILLAHFITLTKFVYICVWKRMRQMNDDLIVQILINWTVFLSLWISFGISIIDKGVESTLYVWCTQGVDKMTWQSLSPTKKILSPYPILFLRLRPA